MNLYLTDRDPEILEFERELTDLSLDRMTDDQGWIFGFKSRFDRRWRLSMEPVEGEPVVAVGAQLTAALSWLRLYHQTGDATYLDRGKALGDLATRFGFDRDRGCWYDLITLDPPHRPVPSARVSWWIQFYGAFLQLQLHRVTGDETYLDNFRRTEEFYLDHMIDPEFGGTFAAVTPDGELANEGRKAHPWRTSYHELEHAFLNDLYLNLYVHEAPATLHFRLDGGPNGRRHHVSPVDDPSIGIASVTIDGQPWDDFDAAERSVIVPPGHGHRVVVTLAPSDGQPGDQR